MRKLYFLLWITFLVCFEASAQNYFVELADLNDVQVSVEDTTLLDSISKEVALLLTPPDQSDFKVYDFEFYLHHGKYEDGIENAKSLMRQKVQNLTDYYILFGRESNEDGLFMNFHLELNFPAEGEFACLSDTKLDLVKTKVIQHLSSYRSSISSDIRNYAKAQIEAIEIIKEEIENIVGCCFFNLRDPQQCTCSNLDVYTSEFEARDMVHFDIESAAISDLNVPLEITTDSSFILRKGASTWNITDELKQFASDQGLTEDAVRFSVFNDLTCFDIEPYLLGQVLLPGQNNYSSRNNENLKVEFVLLMLEGVNRIFFKIHDEDTAPINDAYDKLALKVAAFAQDGSYSNLASQILLEKCLGLNDNIESIRNYSKFNTEIWISTFWNLEGNIELSSSLSGIYTNNFSTNYDDVSFSYFEENTSLNEAIYRFDKSTLTIANLSESNLAFEDLYFKIQNCFVPDEFKGKIVIICTNDDEIAYGGNTFFVGVNEKITLKSGDHPAAFYGIEHNNPTELSGSLYSIKSGDNYYVHESVDNGPDKFVLAENDGPEVVYSSTTNNFETPILGLASIQSCILQLFQNEIQVSQNTLGDCDCNTLPEGPDFPFIGFSSFIGGDIENYNHATSSLRMLNFEEDKAEIINQLNTENHVYSNDFLYSNEMKDFNRMIDDRLKLFEEITESDPDKNIDNVYFITQKLRYTLPNEDLDEIFNEIYTTLQGFSPGEEVRLYYAAIFEDKGVFGNAPLASTSERFIVQDKAAGFPTSLENIETQNKNLMSRFLKLFSKIPKTHKDIVYKFYPSGKIERVISTTHNATDKDSNYSLWTSKHSRFQEYKKKQEIIDEYIASNLYNPEIHLGLGPLFEELRLLRREIDSQTSVDYFQEPERILKLKEKFITEESVTIHLFYSSGDLKGNFTLFTLTPLSELELYDFSDKLLFDQLVYTIIDVLQFTPYVGAVFDLAGIIYAGANGDIMRLGEYSLGLTLNLAFGGNNILADIAKETIQAAQTKGTIGVISKIGNTPVKIISNGELSAIRGHLEAQGLSVDDALQIALRVENDEIAAEVLLNPNSLTYIKARPATIDIYTKIDELLITGFTARLENFIPRSSLSQADYDNYVKILADKLKLRRVESESLLFADGILNKEIATLSDELKEILLKDLAEGTDDFLSFLSKNEGAVNAWKAINDLPYAIRTNTTILSKGDELMTLGFSKTEFRVLATLDDANALDIAKRLREKHVVNDVPIEFDVITDMVDDAYILGDDVVASLDNISQGPGKLRTPENLSSELSNAVNSNQPNKAGIRLTIEDGGSRVKNSSDIEIENGHADLEDFTLQESIQHKLLTGSDANFRDELNKACQQLRGEFGETPTFGNTTAHVKFKESTSSSATIHNMNRQELFDYFELDAVNFDFTDVKKLIVDNAVDFHEFNIVNGIIQF